MKNLKDKLKRKTCPDETLINRYVLHQCSQKERHEIETHLSECPFCRKEVVFLTQSQAEIQDEEQWDELPEWMINKSMGLVKEIKNSMLEIFLQFIRGQWKIVRHSGIFVPQPVPAAREDASAHKVALPPLIKEFKEYRVEVSFEGDVEGAINVRVKVKKIPDGDLVSKVQFILNDEKEQKIITSLIGDGMAFFEGLSPGEYSIDIAQQKKNIGTISLNLKKD